MKKIVILSMAGMLALTSGCSKKGDDNQDIQREEEMNRGDLIDDSYKQSDVAPEPAPSNMNRPE